jgi:hypothetical protein
MERNFKRLIGNWLCRVFLREEVGCGSGGRFDSSENGIVLPTKIGSATRCRFVWVIPVLPDQGARPEEGSIDEHPRSRIGIDTGIGTVIAIAIGIEKP